MESDVKVTLSDDKIKEIIKTYNHLGNLLETILPKERIYQESFRKGLEEALREMETRRSQKVQSFDEFVK